jgi:hypothetical protein
VSEWCLDVYRINTREHQLLKSVRTINRVPNSIVCIFLFHAATDLASMVKARVNELIKELERLRLCSQRNHARQVEVLDELRDQVILEAEVSIDYIVGDRVRITTTSNSRPQGKAATEQDRIATVTGTTPTRVNVVTDNNFHTWRARKNVTKL